MRSPAKRNRPWLLAPAALLLSVTACAAQESRPSADEEPAAAPATSAAAETPQYRFPDPPIPSITATELLAALEADGGPVVLDVRTTEEFEAAHVPGAINIPYDEVATRLDSLEAFRDRGLVVYCRTGRRAGDAAAVLQQAGFERLWDLEGHMVKWKAYELPLAGDCC